MTAILPDVPVSIPVSTPSVGLPIVEPKRRDKLLPLHSGVNNEVPSVSEPRAGIAAGTVCEQHFAEAHHHTGMILARPDAGEVLGYSRNPEHQARVAYNWDEGWTVTVPLGYDPETGELLYRRYFGQHSRYSCAFWAAERGFTTFVRSVAPEIITRAEVERALAARRAESANGEPRNNDDRRERNWSAKDRAARAASGSTTRERKPRAERATKEPRATRERKREIDLDAGLDALLAAADLDDDLDALLAAAEPEPTPEPQATDVE